VTSRLSFAHVAASCAALTPLCRPIRHRVEDGAGGRVSLMETDCYVLVTLGGEGHSSVGSAIGT